VERRKKILLAAVVLVVGVVLALQFRKSEFVKSHFSTVSGWHAEPPVQPTGSHGATVTSQDGANPPGVTAFDGHIEAAPGQVENANRSAPSDETGGGNSLSPNPDTASSPGPLVDMNAPEQTHTIVDGDTLQDLAQHYLGRADRSMELFQYNRDVLRSPDMLPIGAELRIPSQVVLPATGGAPALPSAPTTPISPLVPLPQMPTSPLPSAGKATIPASAQNTAGAQRPAPRTYTVQAGDNLVDIARKFYGDGRRYETIYEANRRVMHNPTDLKPGMVLVVP